jgi:hypothetical protein
MNLSPGDQLTGKLRLNERMAPLSTVRTYRVTDEFGDRCLKAGVVGAIHGRVETAMRKLALGARQIIERFPYIDFSIGPARHHLAVLMRPHHRHASLMLDDTLLLDDV